MLFYQSHCLSIESCVPPNVLKTHKHSEPSSWNSLHCTSVWHSFNRNNFQRVLCNENHKVVPKGEHSLHGPFWDLFGFQALWTSINTDTAKLSLKTAFLCKESNDPLIYRFSCKMFAGWFLVIEFPLNCSVIVNLPQFFFVFMLSFSHFFHAKNNCSVKRHIFFIKKIRVIFFLIPLEYEQSLGSKKPKLWYTVDDLLGDQDGWIWICDFMKKVTIYRTVLLQVWVYKDFSLLLKLFSHAFLPHRSDMNQ